MSAIPSTPRPDMQGVSNQNAVLTWDVVRTIRHRYTAESLGCAKLAAEYGVSRQTIRQIIRNAGWTDPGYSPPTEMHDAAVLTWDQVRSIRQERATNGITYQTLATKYGVSIRAIQLIVFNERWVDHAYTPPAPRSYTRTR